LLNNNIYSSPISVLKLEPLVCLLPRPKPVAVSQVIIAMAAPLHSVI
jgi:hypothetical protein